MPPKKKGKGKKGPVLIDGVDTSSMTRDQLEAFALRLKAEMEREREERNFFQLERDKIRMFWEITRGQLAETREELRQKDHEVEMATEMSHIDSTHITQQMKHLQYENHTKIGEVRAEAMAQLQIAQENHVAQEQELLRDKRELRKTIREREETNDMQLEQLRLKHFEEIWETRISFENRMKDMKLLHDERMLELKEETELICRMSMFEVEERKNAQIQRLIENHDKAYNDMKNYYNDITLNNLGLITSLKEQMEVLRKQAERNERIAGETILENRKLREPLEQAQIELAELRRKMEHFDRDRLQLGRLKTRNTFVEKRLKALTWETEALLLRNETLVKERDNLNTQFESVVTEMQQKTSLKNVLLERKLTLMEHDGEKREAILKETMTKCGIKDGEEMMALEERVASTMDEKNKMIQDLQYELVRVCKAHDDLIAAYESKLAEYDVPKSELGFEPLRFTTRVRYLCGPAGLVSKNQ